MLLLAGDLTERGTPEQARCLAREVSYMGLPIVAVLGNHDHLTSRAAAVTAALPDAGVQVVDQTCTVPTVGARGWVWPA